MMKETGQVNWMMPAPEEDEEGKMTQQKQVNQIAYERSLLLLLWYDRHNYCLMSLTRISFAVLSRYLFCAVLFVQVSNSRLPCGDRETENVSQVS